MMKNVLLGQALVTFYILHVSVQKLLWVNVNRLHLPLRVFVLIDEVCNKSGVLAQVHISLYRRIFHYLREGVLLHDVLIPYYVLFITLYVIPRLRKVRAACENN